MRDAFCLRDGADATRGGESTVAAEGQRLDAAEGDGVAGLARGDEGGEEGGCEEGRGWGGEVHRFMWKHVVVI